MSPVGFSRIAKELFDMGNLVVHVLNVGKGSSAFIDFPSGNLAMVDIDDSRTFREEDVMEIVERFGIGNDFYRLLESNRVEQATRVFQEAYNIILTDPIDYYQNNFYGRPIFRFMLTHPDMDHMSGIDRLRQNVELMNFWDTCNSKSVDSGSWGNSPYRKEDWDAYQSLRNSESSPKTLYKHRNESGDYWSQDGITILSPSIHLDNLAEHKKEYNHNSYVFMMEHSGSRILHGGDATIEAWDDILEYWGQDALKADVLIAPHHGSKSHFHKEAMEAVNPDLTVVSVAVGTPYAYDEYRRFGKVMSTKWYGNIVISINDWGEIEYNSEYVRSAAEVR